MSNPQSVHDWIQQQSTILKNPDINMLIDLFATSPSDDEVRDLAYGVLGEGVLIRTFVDNLNKKRQLAGISSQIKSEPHVSTLSHVINTGLINPPPAANVKQSSAQSNKSQATKSQPTHPQLQQQTIRQLQQKPLQPKSSFDLSSYSQPTVLSTQSSLPDTTPQKQVQSFAQATQKGQSKLQNANGSSVEKVGPPKHAKSFDSGLFFTENDVAVLDIARLMHQDVVETNNSIDEPEATHKELFPSFNAKERGSKSNNNDVELNRKQSSTHHITVIDKKKPTKSVKSSASQDPQSVTPLDNQIDQNNMTANPPQDEKKESLGDFLNNITLCASRNATRPECNCMARQHKFYANCHDCGRILCQFEGEGDCFYCGAYVINFDQNIDISNQFSHYQSKIDEKMKKNGNGNPNSKHGHKKQQTTLVNETRQALFDSVDSNKSTQLADLFGTTITEKDIEQLNTNGNGVLCVSNEIFFEKMVKWCDRSQGYYFRHPSAPKPPAVLQYMISKQDNNTDMNSGNANNIDKRVSSIDIRSNSAYGIALGAGSMSETERFDAGLNRALEFRNTLIQREKEKAKRTTVIDEQADYYDFQSNIWLDEQEKEKKAAIADKVEEMIETKNENRTLTIEFDEKTGKMKQILTKVDLSMHGIGSVGGGMADFVEKSTQIVDKQYQDAIQQSDSDIVTIQATGHKYSRNELSKRKEFLTMKRRVDIEKQKKDAEEAVKQQQLLDEKDGKTTIRQQRDKQRQKSDMQPQAQTSRGWNKKDQENTTFDTQHLSGRALLVYQTLKETLTSDTTYNDSENKSISFKPSAWSERLSVLDEMYDDEYDFFLSNPEQYAAEGFTPLYTDGIATGIAGGNVTEHNTDSGCG